MNVCWMNAPHRIITRLPLEELWREDGLAFSRVRPLTVDDIAGLLRLSQIHFVIADVGSPPLWLPAADCCSFWKDEVKPHLAESGARLEEFPGNYFYFASEWSRGDSSLPIVVLEKHH